MRRLDRVRDRGEHVFDSIDLPERGPLWPTSSSSGAPASTTSRTSRSTCPATRSSSSPGCPARASPASPSTRSSPRASAATSSRCRRTPASSSARWTSPTSTSSRACRPAVSIDQKSTSKNPRSTVGTITEVYDYLRLLYARAGRAALPRRAARRSSGRRRSRSSTGSSRSRRAAASRCSRRSSAAARASTSSSSASSRPQGFTRARVDGETHTLDEPPTLEKQNKHTIEVVVDRLAVKASSKRRLTDSVETALGLAGGLVRRRLRRPRRQGPGPRAAVLARRWPAPTTTPSTPTSSSRARSRSTRPFGACPECTGLGTRMEVDPELVVPDPSATLGEGAIAPWSRRPRRRLLPAAARRARRGARLRPRHARGTSCRRRRSTSLLDGHTTKVHVVTRNRYGRERAYYAAFEGVRPYIERRHREAESDTSRERFEGFMREVPCPACQRHPAQAGVAGGDPRRQGRGRQEHRRGLRAADQRGRRLPPHRRAVRARAPDRRAGAQGDPGAARLPARRRPRLPLASTGPPARCPAARRSGSGSRPRSAPASSACSTSSTSRRSACTSATTTG